MTRFKVWPTAGGTVSVRQQVPFAPRPFLYIEPGLITKSWAKAHFKVTGPEKDHTAGSLVLEIASLVMPLAQVTATDVE